MAINNGIGSGDNLIYHGPKADRINHTVVIVDFSDKMPYSPWLAKEYILSPKDPLGSCIHNAKVCQKHGRLDLYKVWYLAVEMLRNCVPEELPEPEKLVREGPIANEKMKRVSVDPLQDAKALFDTHLTNEPLDSLLSVISQTVKRVKWGMHPFGQKLVGNL